MSVVLCGFGLNNFNVILKKNEGSQTYPINNSMKTRNKLKLSSITQYNIHYFIIIYDKFISLLDHEHI